MQLHSNRHGPSHKRLAIVARVSSEDQAEHGTSLDDQVAKGRLLAQLHEYTVDDRAFEEGGSIYSGDESGSLRPAQRPIVQRLIADARAKKFDAVCFTKIDRIARRLKYMLEVWDALDDAGCAVLVIDPPLDTSTPVGQLIRNVLGSIAEFEAATILERTMGGRRRKLARGELFLPTGKYGYTYTPMDRSTHTPGHVAIHEQHAQVVRRLFARRALGLSYERIAAELTADGIPSPEGKAQWRSSTVLRIVSDGAYKGAGTWGRGRAMLSERTGRRVLRPRTDGPTAHPPGVPPHRRRRAVGGRPGRGRRRPGVRGAGQRRAVSAARRPGALCRARLHDDRLQ
jgi:site-specific DNA recombinase